MADRSRPDAGTAMLAGVLWDLDGTLIDSEPVWREAQLRLAAEFDSSWSSADGLAYAGRPMEVTIAAMQASGIQVSAELIRARVLREVTESLRRHLPWCAGALELVEELRGARVAQAIVTTSPRSMVDVVLDWLPPDTFAVVVSGDDVIRRKPDPEPYLAAVRALGAVPGRCVAIEDSPSGLASALATGVVTIGVPNGTDLPPAPGWTRLPSLRDLGIDQLHELLEVGSTN